MAKTKKEQKNYIISLKHRDDKFRTVYVKKVGDGITKFTNVMREAYVFPTEPSLNSALEFVRRDMANNVLPFVFKTSSMAEIIPLELEYKTKPKKK